MIGFEWSILANVALTAIVLALAYVSRLPAQQAAQIIEHRDEQLPPVTA